jgi:Membrane proteins related to metalloendopeptidases
MTALTSWLRKVRPLSVRRTAQWFPSPFQKREKATKVVISHGGGIETAYSHLAKISVGRGMRLRRGSVIGTVGSTGSSLAAHLHYEVWKDGTADNPVNYFFADLNSHEYREVYIISSTTGQSMD